jgi:hypothetical protein
MEDASRSERGVGCPCSQMTGFDLHSSDGYVCVHHRLRFEVLRAHMNLISETRT